MFLAIDVGNTQTALGLIDDSGKLVHGWRMATDKTDTSDMVHARLVSYCQKDDIELGTIEAAGLSCVVPVLTRAWEKCLKQHLSIDVLRVSASTNTAIKLDVPNPATVGADRIANAIAAKTSYGAPVIVVDFGTATNIDVVNREGAYVGGAISPGLVLSADALFERAAKLSSIEIVAPEKACGSTTEAAVQSGLVIGAAAQAEGLVARIKDELKLGDAPVVATGGLAYTVSKATELFDHIDPDLTLRGIYELWQKR